MWKVNKLKVFESRVNDINFDAADFIRRLTIINVLEWLESTYSLKSLRCPQEPSQDSKLINWSGYSISQLKTAT